MDVLIFSSPKRIGTNGKFTSKQKPCIYLRQLLVVAKLKNVSIIINYQIKIILIHFTSFNTTLCHKYYIHDTLKIFFLEFILILISVFSREVTLYCQLCILWVINYSKHYSLKLLADHVFLLRVSWFNIRSFK